MLLDFIEKLKNCQSIIQEIGNGLKEKVIFNGMMKKTMKFTYLNGNLKSKIIHVLLKDTKLMIIKLKNYPIGKRYT